LASKYLIKRTRYVKEKLTDDCRGSRVHRGEEVIPDEVDDEEGHSLFQAEWQVVLF
jgi:hypothetical protein